MAERITSEQFPEKVLQSELPVLVEFYSDSCIPCKRLSPVLSRLESAFADTLHIYKVNVHFEEALTEEYDILGSPTLLFFKNGQEINRLRGVVSEEELTEAVTSLKGA